MENQLHRYPGITPFSEEQENVFFGRDRDIENLKNLILVRNQVLLYAKSGIGKTSLINAGVLPLLTEKHTPVQIRFTAYTKDSNLTPIENVINKINVQKNSEQTILDTLIEHTSYEKTLWFYLKQVQLLQKEKPYIIIFDQFEELFTYPDAQIAEFKEQLSQIIKTETPDEIFELISQKPELEEHPAIDDLYNEIKVKTVYAIRSDKLSLLNQLSDKISNIQRDYYELKPLTAKQATEAILKPAQKNDSNFITDSFDFDSTAIESIINALSNKSKQHIETTQLQIVCQRIEEIALEKQRNTLSKVIIGKNDLPEFKDIFFSFYENAVNETNEVENTHVFIEDHLIRNKQRISLDERICIDFIKKETLKKLTSLHLLRAEPNSTGGFNYELSHDTLVKPILTSRKVRKEKEEKQFLKDKGRKIRAKLLKERKRQHRIIYIVSIAALISIGFGIFGFVNMQKANHSLTSLKQTQYKSNFEKGKKFQDEAKFELAIKQYKIALEFLKEKQAIANIISCEGKIGKEKEFNKLLKEAELLFTNNEWESSIKKYIAANNIDYINISETISQKKKIVIELLKNDLKEYEEMPNADIFIKKTNQQINSIENLN